VKVGDYSRAGKNRVEVHAADHDFPPEAVVTPVGVFLPQHNELSVYGVTSKVTRDGLVDILCPWWQTNKERFPHVKMLRLNLDNEQECHSRRTQFLSRLVQFVAETGMTLALAYSPPYHRKYNPIERCWGRLSKMDQVDLLQESSKMNFSAGGVPPCRASHSQGKRISSVGRLFLSRVRSCTRLTQDGSSDRLVARLTKRQAPCFNTGLSNTLVFRTDTFSNRSEPTNTVVAPCDLALLTDTLSNRSLRKTNVYQIWKIHLPVSGRGDYAVTGTEAEARYVSAATMAINGKTLAAASFSSSKSWRASAAVSMSPNAVA